MVTGIKFAKECFEAANLAYKSINLIKNSERQ
jgi:hypothetical protein